MKSSGSGKGRITREVLEQVVATDDKRRFAFSADGRSIRASQGHTAQVDLGYQPTAPPAVLFHGTAERNLGQIRRKGLLRGRRHHVHLSDDRETATKVGRRYGTPVVLVIRAAEMAAAGKTFFRSANGVWLTDSVPPVFIDFPR